ncbi:hypothetical protein [Bacteroides fragilis]|uniref:hypothetical protein n=1 Tax=Bacteroides fragilis TaxID=817 RepID=UPI0020303444|nr:hypothetical protein [Bacteroides fragilis]
MICLLLFIKEVIVRTPVESKKAPQETFPKEWMEKMKREVVEELRQENRSMRTGKIRKDR